MTFKHSFKTAVNGLKTHKSRSVLTILGIVIGITSIILIVSLGEGAQALILGQFQGVGAKTVVISPGQEPKGPMDATTLLFSDSLKERELNELKKKANVPYATRVEPLMLGSEVVSYGNETYRPVILGGTPYLMEIYDIEVDRGREVSDEDVSSKAAVAVIGPKVVEELFGNDDPLGQKIRIKGQNFRIIGTLPKKGQMSFLNFDGAIFVPYTTAQQYVFGFKYYHNIIIETETEAQIPHTIDDIETTLRTLHNITDPEKDDFYVETQEGAMEQVATVTNILTLFLAAVAAISLLVGGIGIMNIMLVSVTERTREIGLRKALGATGGDILTQFLLEAVILTALGGVIGIALGASFSFLASLILTSALNVDWAFSFPVGAAILGLAVAALVGLVFGIYPARQASKKSPIEALRYE
jgi:putative ABC transport system permease protein